MRIISEPTAAALAYGLRFRSTDLKKCLVFDLGGGTFDVTVLTIQGDEITVQAHAGDPHLGGQDIDNKLMDECIEEFKRTHGNDLSNDQKAKAKIKKASTDAKIELSNADEADINIESLSPGCDLDMVITREYFETLCEPIFERCMPPIR